MENLSVTAQAINGGRVLRVVSDCPTFDLNSTELIAAEIAENAGAALVKLEMRLPNGTLFNLLSLSGPKEIEKKFRRAEASADLYAKNVFFQKGSGAPLWPLANRLAGRRLDDHTIEAKVMGQTVRMALNNGRGEGQTPHHLHGLLFELAADETSAISESAISSTFHFDSSVQWPSRSEIKITQGFQNGAFEFRMTTKNIGLEAMPIGAGAHPYFVAPSKDRASVRVVIPAKRLVEIDGFENVLPTGHIRPISEKSPFDFNFPGGAPLGDHHFDNLFVGLIPDKDGFAYTEFIDLKAKLRIRMTALTKNVIGIQMYAPKPTEDPESEVFAALELVTNLPDPREELWGATPTGMQLLEPGDTHEYGYRIEVLKMQ